MAEIELEECRRQREEKDDNWNDCPDGQNDNLHTDVRQTYEYGGFYGSKRYFFIGGALWKRDYQ